MARVGVVLSGCGVFDGSEIHEAVLTLLALDEADAEVVCMAPAGRQMHVIDHLTQDVSGEERDILVESARIARGRIRDIATVRAEELDALVFPGGFGAAKNLCDFAVKGPECAVHPEIERLVREMHGADKPLGFACISPALAAAVFRAAGVSGVSLTVGDPADDAAGALAAMGAVHVACPVDEAHADLVNRVVSTPAYMYPAPRIREVRAGIAAMVRQLLALL